MKRIPAILVTTTLLHAARLMAADSPPAPPPAAPATAGGKVFAPKELDAMRALKGQTIKIEGTIVKQGESKNATVRYLNFSDRYQESISLVFMVSKGAGAFTKEKLAEYVGKKVQVTGPVSEFNNNLQIEMKSLDQIKIVE
jgi:RecJ-like exonuclease